MSRAAAGALIAAAVLSACSGGGDPEPPPTDVSVEQLAIMVVPKDELGEPAAGLELDARNSGADDNAGAAVSSIDPLDTADGLARAGRITGYALDYVDPGLTSLTGEAGVFQLGTRVHLFQDDRAAEAFLAKQESDFVRLEGEVREDGVQVSRVETFAVDDLGDDSFGLTAVIAFQGVRTSGTFVAFTVGRLVGTTGLLRGASVAGDVGAVTAIARSLEQRMRGVLAGEIVDEPEPLPREEPGLGPPPGEFDPAAMALAPADLAAGAGIEREGYVDDPDAVAAFERVFASRGLELDGSRLVGLASGARLYDSAVIASFALDALDAGAATGPAALAGAGDGTALAGPIARDGVGDAAVAFESASGGRRVTVLFVRVGRAVGWLAAVLAERGPADVGALARTLAGRVDAGFTRRG
jgi:hypothetical protein